MKSETDGLFIGDRNNPVLVAGWYDISGCEHGDKCGLCTLYISGYATVNTHGFYGKE